mmetsp:Transcript_15115/g.34891  ORF Transcript_15115/g.34891 Transcript_15115/m.34891 type:complete len:106 (-) Transcript_15115:579-896(-)
MSQDSGPILVGFVALTRSRLLVLDSGSMDLSPLCSNILDIKQESDAHSRESQAQQVEYITIMGNKVSSLLDELIDLRIASKPLQRISKKCEANEKALIEKVKKEC